MSWAAAASVGASVVGGMMGDDASGDAADAQGASADLAIKEIREIGDRTRSDTRQYRNLGGKSADRLSTLLGLETSKYEFDNPAANDEVSRLMDDRINRTGADYYTTVDQVAKGWGATPTRTTNTGDADFGSLLNKFNQRDLDGDIVYNSGLKFGLDEGLKALGRRQLSLGGYDSGAGIKAATRYANDYGSTKAEGAYNRFMGDKQFTLSSLLGATGVGQNAVALDANTGAQMAQAVGNAQMGAGNARAAGIVGGANAWGNAMSGVSGAFNQYQTNRQTDRILNGMGY